MPWVVAAVQRWLVTHHQWLVICDNVDTPELLYDFLPSVPQGTLLITTRCPALGPLALGLDVQPLGTEEGRLLLLRRAGVLVPDALPAQVSQMAAQRPAEYAAAEELVRVLGGLPLALDQAGAYLQETGCSLADYLQRYQQQRASLLSRRGTSAGYHPHSVGTTFQLAMEQIRREQPAATDFLQVCALLQAEAIPEELFLQGAGYLGPQLQSLRAEPLCFDQIIAVLRRFSLIGREAEAHTLSLHRLVQAVVLDAMTAGEHTLWRRRVIEALDAVFPQVQTAMEHALWLQCERLLPHALCRLQQEMEEEPSLASASLAYHTSQYLREHGRYGEAEPLYQRVLHIREQQLGSQHPDVASLLDGLATLSLLQGRYGEAEPLYQRALHIREQQLGPVHPDTARSLNNLAALCQSQGKYREAEPLYQRALSICEQQLGPMHLDTASSLNNLAALYHDQGKYGEAEPLYQRVLSICEQQLGPMHPDTARSLNNLAALYHDQSKYGEAEPLYQLALHIRQQQLGPMHPDTASSLNNLAGLYSCQGKYSEAEPLYREALAIREEVLGAHHPKTQETQTASHALFEQVGEDQQ